MGDKSEEYGEIADLNLLASEVLINYSLSYIMIALTLVLILIELGRIFNMGKIYITIVAASYLFFAFLQGIKMEKDKKTFLSTYEDKINHHWTQNIKKSLPWPPSSE
jgi:hypothetical protein